MRSLLVVVASLLGAALLFAALLFPALLFPAQADAQRRGRRAPTPAQVERARTLFVQGSEHYQAGRLDQALEAFLEAWRAVPSPELAYNVARTYERMGEAQRGIEFYRHYLRRAAPDATEREEVEGRIRELEAIARRQREQIMTAPPSDDALTREARTFFERGVAMFRRRQYEAAMQAFTAAYNFARLPEVVYNLAVTAERLDRTQDAIDFFREYARSLPRDSAERAIVDRRVRELRGR
ncbi:MAG: tetratricopeptide repeat protein [Myxococcota bacterium]|nr:tetratricopeptide repeat protein [Myxococcota bacterium]